MLYELWRLGLFSFGGYGLALAALALVVFGAIECPPSLPTCTQPIAYRWNTKNFNYIRIYVSSTIAYSLFLIMIEIANTVKVEKVEAFDRSKRCLIKFAPPLPVEGERHQHPVSPKIGPVQIAASHKIPCELYVSTRMSHGCKYQ